MNESQESPLDLKNWKAAKVPQPVAIYGRTVMLEPLNSELHAADLWEAVHGHDEVWSYLADGPYECEADLRRALEDKQAGSNVQFFALITEEHGRSEGYASYMRIEPAHGVVEVGNILLTPALQRTRAATEAMYLMARHAFQDLGYRRYEWKCNAENEPSRRAALRFGFTFEGIFRQHMVVKGRSRDTAWFAMLDSEWPARKRAFEAWLDPGNFDDQGQQRHRLSEFA